MIKTGVIGASGYAGAELMRLIEGHPHFTLQCAVANSFAGTRIVESFPNLDLEISHFSAIDDVNFDELDLVFLALPHGESHKLVSDIPEKVLVVDLGADFRLTDESQWIKFYRSDYPGHWIYGLADISQSLETIKNSKRIANPGCYATAINLSLAPFLLMDAVQVDEINVVAASGTSGAGRKASTGLMTAENMNNLVPYKVGGIHQHIPEIEQFFRSISNKPAKVCLTPILAPMPRGILAITTVPLKENVPEEDLRESFGNFYQGNPFVKLLPNNMQPQTKATLGTNNALFQVTVNQDMNQLIVSAAIDNLVKGAAGQAVQNANLISGLPMATGLNTVGIYP